VRGPSSVKSAFEGLAAATRLRTRESENIVEARGTLQESKISLGISTIVNGSEKSGDKALVGGAGAALYRAKRRARRRGIG
jgi:PleD family two-component response regulator